MKDPKEKTLGKYQQFKPTPTSSFSSPIAKRHDKNNIPEFPSVLDQDTEKNVSRVPIRSPTSVTFLSAEDENMPKSP